MNLNDTMKARREELGALRDHFVRELELAMKRRKCIEYFPTGRGLLRVGAMLVKEHDVGPAMHYTSILVNSAHTPRRVAQMDWLYRKGTANLRITAGMHVIERHASADVLRKLGPVSFTREGFLVKFQGEEQEGLGAEGLSLGADLIAALFKAGSIDYAKFMTALAGRPQG